MSHNPRYAITTGPAPDWQVAREARRVENLHVRQAEERFGRKSSQRAEAVERRTLVARFSELTTRRP